MHNPRFLIRAEDFFSIVGDGEGLSLTDFVIFCGSVGDRSHTDLIDLTDFWVAVSFIAHRFCGLSVRILEGGYHLQCGYWAFLPMSFAMAMARRVGHRFSAIKAMR